MLISGCKYMENLDRKLGLIRKGYMSSSMKTTHLQAILQVELECRNGSETRLWNVVRKCKM